MITRYFGVHERVDSFEALVAKYADDELASPARSTVPLLDYWRDPAPRVEHLLSRLGIEADPSYSQLHFEFPVAVRAGRGKSSFTDLMIVTPRCAIAIEAKYREPAYPTVAKWLGEPPSANKVAVLEGWLDAIQSTTGCALCVDDVKGVTYQLIHRTASVCCQSRRMRTVLYQVFGDSAPSHYLEQLRRFAEVLSNGNIAFRIMQCGFQPTAMYTALLSRWGGGERSMGSDVRGALSNPLCRFANVVL